MTAIKNLKKNMQKASCLTVIVLATCYFVGPSRASDVTPGEKHAEGQRSGIHLSDDVKAILNQEMVGIENGMKEIIPALSSGDWKRIADIASKIKKSFILKQKLNQKQLQELHDSLPPEFVEMDLSFHSSAGKLAHAAVQHDGELVSFYYYKLHSQCIKCHARYASDRFPGLKNVNSNNKDHD